MNKLDKYLAQTKMVPLKRGAYLVILSRDKKAWVVCGNLCARRVEHRRMKNPNDKNEALKVALSK